MAKKKKTLKKRVVPKKKAKTRVKKKIIKKKVLKQKTAKKRTTKKRAKPKIKVVKKKQQRKNIHLKIKKDVIEHISKSLSEKHERRKIGAHISKKILVDDLMLRNPITLPKNAPLVDAVGLLHKYKLRSIIIVDDKKPIGILSEDGILSAITSSVNIKEKPIEENPKELEKVLKHTVSSVMVKMDKHVKKTTPVETAVKIMNSYELDQIPVVNNNNELIGTLLLDNILEFMDRDVIKKEIVEKEVIETGIDKLLDYIESQKEITTKEAAEALKMPLSDVEKFARILKDHDLIDIDFSRIGTIKLIKKEREEV